MSDADQVQQANEERTTDRSGSSDAEPGLGLDLELDQILRELLARARALTGADYAGVATLDSSGSINQLISSGQPEQESWPLLDQPGGPELFRHLSRESEPRRVTDLARYAASVGLPDPPLLLRSLSGVVFAPIATQRQALGCLLVADRAGGSEFSSEDEQTLHLLASMAALTIAGLRVLGNEQQARAELENLMDASAVGVVVVDAETGRPTSFNREARRLIDQLSDDGQTLEQLHEVLRFQCGDSSEAAVSEFDYIRVLSSGDRLRASEVALEAPDGRQIRVIATSAPVRAADGGVASFIVTLQDLTPLADLEVMRAEFLAMVSHELRAPLTSIKGSAATLASDGASMDAAETEQFHRIINEQADLMRRLITDLLDMARIDAGDLSVSPERLEVITLVDRARAAFQSGGGTSNILIELPPELPAVVADPQRIVQVLGNLLTNAERYSPTTSMIRLSAEERDAQVEFCIADDGAGIPPEQLPRLFQKFSGRRTEDGSEASDTGLGLAISKGLIEAHGGRIWAESEGAGKGAQLRFTLPIAEQQALVETLDQPRSDAPARRASRNRIRVLVVDDDPHMLRYVRDTLNKAGFEPILTGDPEAIGALIAEHRPQLVLLDLILPETDGIELMEEIPALAELPVIFISAYGGDRRIARALEVGADDYIAKPFSQTELVARIQTVLRRWTSAEPAEPFKHDGLTIDYSRRRVTLDGTRLALTDLEYRLLAELAINLGRPMTHAELLQRVWGPANSGREGAVRTVVKQLRHKLGDNSSQPRFIESVRRVGYRMPEADLPEDVEQAAATPAP
ncbi:MAG: response regulator [Chloroflexota bacterium]|nr:response regulator [Chloroflexota bacterium]